jgi:hypothetical protein
VCGQWGGESPLFLSQDLNIRTGDIAGRVQQAASFDTSHIHRQSVLGQLYRRRPAISMAVHTVDDARFSLLANNMQTC